MEGDVVPAPTQRPQEQEYSETSPSSHASTDVPPGAEAAKGPVTLLEQHAISLGSALAAISELKRDLTALQQDNRRWQDRVAELENQIRALASQPFRPSAQLEDLLKECISLLQTSQHFSGRSLRPGSRAGNAQAGPRDTDGLSDVDTPASVGLADLVNRLRSQRAGIPPQGTTIDESPDVRRVEDVSSPRKDHSTLQIVQQLEESVTARVLQALGIADVGLLKSLKLDIQRLSTSVAGQSAIVEGILSSLLKPESLAAGTGAVQPANNQPAPEYSNLQVLQGRIHHSVTSQPVQVTPAPSPPLPSRQSTESPSLRGVHSSPAPTPLSDPVHPPNTFGADQPQGGRPALAAAPLLGTRTAPGAVGTSLPHDTSFLTSPSSASLSVAQVSDLLNLLQLAAAGGAAATAGGSAAGNPPLSGGQPTSSHASWTAYEAASHLLPASDRQNRQLHRISSLVGPAPSHSGPPHSGAGGSSAAGAAWPGASTAMEPRSTNPLPEQGVAVRGQLQQAQALLQPLSAPMMVPKSGGVPLPGDWTWPWSNDIWQASQPAGGVSGAWPPRHLAHTPPLMTHASGQQLTTTPSESLEGVGLLRQYDTVPSPLSLAPSAAIAESPREAPGGTTALPTPPGRAGRVQPPSSSALPPVLVPPGWAPSGETSPRLPGGRATDMATAAAEEAGSSGGARHLTRRNSWHGEQTSGVRLMPRHSQGGLGDAETVCWTLQGYPAPGPASSCSPPAPLALIPASLAGGAPPLSPGHGAGIVRARLALSATSSEPSGSGTSLQPSPTLLRVPLPLPPAPFASSAAAAAAALAALATDDDFPGNVAGPGTGLARGGGPTEVLAGEESGATAGVGSGMAEEFVVEGDDRPWIIIRGLAPWVTRPILTEWFSLFGSVMDVRMFPSVRGQETGRWVSRNFAFILYRTHAQAATAIHWMNGSTAVDLTNRDSGVEVGIAARPY